MRFGLLLMIRLMEYSNEDRRKLIYFLYKEGYSPPSIAKRINAVLCKNSTTPKAYQQWINKLNNSNFDTGEAERTGRPSLDINDKIIECLSYDKYATAAKMAEDIGVGKETVRRHLLRLDKRYLCNRWLPHRLSEGNRANQERICCQLLDMFNENNFLNRIVTEDECWVYWRSNRSYHNRSWFGPDDQPTTSVRQTSKTKKKFLACVFWDAKGLLSMEISPERQSLNSEIYCTLLDDLPDALRSKRRRCAVIISFCKIMRGPIQPKLR